MDALGSATSRTIGWSGGGPHALACAASLPDRCLATVVIASVAPYPAEGIDWLAGMADENIEEFSLTLQGSDALTPFLEAFANSVTTIQPAELAEALGGLLSAVDKAQVTGELAEWMLESSRIGLANGVAGQRDDDLAFMSDWGFELRDVPSVAIWQGAQDRMVPYAHGIWLADHIPAHGADCLIPKAICLSRWDRSRGSSTICWIRHFKSDRVDVRPASLPQRGAAAPSGGHSVSGHLRMTTSSTKGPEEVGPVASLVKRNVTHTCGRPRTLRSESGSRTPRSRSSVVHPEGSR